METESLETMDSIGGVGCRRCPLTPTLPLICPYFQLNLFNLSFNY